MTEREQIVSAIKATLRNYKVSDTTIDALRIGATLAKEFHRAPDELERVVIEVGEELGFKVSRRS